MILLQQPSLVLATLQLQRQSSHKNSATGKKINGTYLPILNSYPRIAPHPGKKPPDKFSSNDKSQNLSKRVCTEHKSEDTPVKRSQPEEHLSKPPKIAPSSGLLCSYLTKDGLSSSSPTTVSSSQGSPSGSSTHTTSSPLSIRGSHRNSSTSARNRRFLNTVEILQQSGLWDITLRTKELLRQSNATERDLAQLRQHTEQLCQAYSNPSCSLNGITAWEHVHRSMAESGSYPNLKILQDLQTPSHPSAASQPESISTSGTHGPLSAESSEGPPPQLLTTITNPNQNCLVPELSHSRHSKELVAGNHASEKVTFMPPDSSTS